MTNDVLERFIRYARIDTQSAAESDTYPSTKKQLDLLKLLYDECNKMGLAMAKLDSYGYVTATLPSNVDHDVPTIGFLAHVDTSPAASGANVKPKITSNYAGGDIVLGKNADGATLTLSPKEFPALNNFIGKDIVTASGDTLLGADDKAGVAEIMTAMQYLINHPEIKHGRVRIAFTPDEEMGGGVDHFNVEEFDAAYAYTLDGGEEGSLEAECFNAVGAVVKITGKSVHPGTAKGVMINAVSIAARFLETLPADEQPETTEHREGFYFASDIKGNAESVVIHVILRDFDKNLLQARKDFINRIAADLNEQYPGAVAVELHDQYPNMKEIIDQRPEILEIARLAMRQVGIIPIERPIRGGTDGSRLSFMGLPCPNIFTGGGNYHGPYEYCVTQIMEKAVNVIINICQLAADK
ncbi:MAG: peptidase T [Clostridiales bacterium]|nr:peptidase T [Clostridiales bacterium]